MNITDALNGKTVEDVRRNPDGSVTLYCDSGNPLTLWVVKGRIEAKPPKIILPEQLLRLEVVGERLNLREAFLGYTIHYAVYDEHGNITFICEPLHHNRQSYAKSIGHREITLTHTNGFINEMPPVSAVIKLPTLSLSGKQG